MNEGPAWFMNLEYFRPSETFINAEGEKQLSFQYPYEMDQRMMLKLDIARDIAGIPFCITSSYREDDDGAHGRGLAVDIRAHGSMEREIIFEALKEAGFFRRGVYDKHIHGDMDASLPPGIWGGVSK